MPDASAPAAHLRSWAEIDPAALAANARFARGRAGGAALLAVVKADAYGHGLPATVRALLGEVEAFGVATLDEALAVRAVAGQGATVLVLGALLPAEREPAVAAGVSATVSGAAEARAFATVARRLGRAARLHLAVDTGMGRIGARPEEFADAARETAAMEGVELEGLATHFPSADEDPAFTESQAAQFAQRCAEAGVAPRWRHLSNSAGLLRLGAAGGDLVRPGLLLYGAAPVAGFDDALRPAMTWRARVTLVRDLPAGASISYGRTAVTDRPTRVATLAVGYADGYPRALSGRGAEVLLAGRRCPLLGRVTMDQIMVDAGALPEPPTPGDAAVLLGCEGGQGIAAGELAQRAGTIAWEIFTGVAPRVARVVVQGDG